MLLLKSASHMWLKRKTVNCVFALYSKKKFRNYLLFTIVCKKKILHIFKGIKKMYKVKLLAFLTFFIWVIKYDLIEIWPL